MKDFILWGLPIAIIIGFFDGALNYVQSIERRRNRHSHKGGEKK